jgi:DNA-binding NtrC family response regulator
VDDDEMAGRVLATFLERLGCQAFPVRSAREARAFLTRWHVDLLVTDLAMPDCDGLELLQWARQEHPGIRVAVVSGSIIAPSTLPVARLLGAVATLPKPFDLEQVRALIAPLFPPPRA